MGSKKTAAQVNQEQQDVPEQFRGNVKMCPDGESVILSHTVPSVIEVKVRKKAFVVVQTYKIAGASRLNAIFERGLKKQICDGAKSEVRYKDAKSGEMITHTFTEAEKQADAVQHAEQMIAWLYGEREKASRKDAVDVVTHECRMQVVAFVCQNMSDTDGTAYTQKSVPSSLARATCLADVQNAAKQIGVPAKYLKGLITRGKAIADLRSDAISTEVDPADLV